MIDTKIAAKELQRLMGLDFFPKEPAAQRELRAALEHAATEQIASRIVSEWLDESSEAPKPAQIKTLLFAANADSRKGKKCAACDNSGWLTVFVLVTYRGNSFDIVKSEHLSLPLNDGTIGTASGKFIGDFRAKLKPNQDIVSAAKPCTCLPANHKYFTGERE